MKSIIIFIFSALLSSAALAQSDIKTDSFKVDGNCNMCKKRIEEAAYVKGVKRAEWNEATHMLTVIYRSSKTDEKTISQSVAKAGHSSDFTTAAEKDYNNLPDCCHYKTNTCSH
ncbi:MAG: hypothetical protein JSS78_11200 [Bacteroidetes bacterium]|nr:hypothetical protein [Bacteroidota bacterium]